MLASLCVLLLSMAYSRDCIKDWRPPLFSPYALRIFALPFGQKLKQENAGSIRSVRVVGMVEDQG